MSAKKTASRTPSQAKTTAKASPPEKKVAAKDASAKEPVATGSGAKAGAAKAPVATGPSSKPCPICGKPPVERYRPFCSKRCADIDLNRWLTGAYAIPVVEEEDEDGDTPDPERG